MFVRDFWYMVFSVLSCVIKLVGSSFEHVVLLKIRKGDSFCTGSLLHKNLILTAGNCCRYEEFHKQIEVHAGLIKGTAKQKAIAKQRFIHPSINACILKLGTPMELEADIKLTRVAKPHIFSVIMRRRGCDKGFSIGYAKDTKSNSYYVDACMVSIDVCGADDDLLCGTLKRYSPIRNCSIHSGGPVMCEGYQVGIALTENGTEVYTRVDRLVSFIHLYSSAAKSSHFKSILVLFLFFSIYALTYQ